MDYLLLIVGVILLIKGADLFVDGSSKLAKAFKIPPIIIGLTIVAFGTSTPEASVSIAASITGNDGISIGNVIGSNIINISLILGLVAILSPLKVERKTIIKEIPLALLGSVALLILLLDKLLGGFSSNTLSRADGIILLLLFAVFLYYIIEVAIKSKNNQNHEQVESLSSKDKKIALLKFFLGLGGLIFGGYLVVENAQSIAISLGMSETLVGLTIVAIGTSLPELITSIVAAIKKESEIALGNIIGSNIFNIMFVLGVSSSIRPIVLEKNLNIDLILMIVLTLVVMIFSTTHNRKINRAEGIIIFIIYIAYLSFIIFRN